MKIAIGIADNHPTFAKQFVSSLLGVKSYFESWVNKGGLDMTLDIIMAENGNVADMRNTVVDTAIKEKYDYIFWMDSDQTFPHDCLPRLLSYCERDGRDAASGLYVYKQPPYLPHVYPKLVEEQGKFAIAPTFPLDVPIKIEGAGFGCLLMKVSVFDRVTRPYFTMQFENGIMTVGEDLPFCKRAKMDMVLDPKVMCGHLNTHAVTVADYLNHNSIKVVDGWVKPTKAQMASVVKKQMKGRKRI
jgi:hypothetical protein